MDVDEERPPGSGRPSAEGRSKRGKGGEGGGKRGGEGKGKGRAGPAAEGRCQNRTDGADSDQGRAGVYPDHGDGTALRQQHRQRPPDGYRRAEALPASRRTLVRRRGARRAVEVCARGGPSGLLRPHPRGLPDGDGALRRPGNGDCQGGGIGRADTADGRGGARQGFPDGEVRRGAEIREDQRHGADLRRQHGHAGHLRREEILRL